MECRVWLWLRMILRDFEMLWGTEFALVEERQ